MTFQELKLSAPLLRAVREAGYETPSPIQASAIPPVLAGRDLLGCAQTGTGKTAAFALPMLDRLGASSVRENPRKKPRRQESGKTVRAVPPVCPIRALILTPTRELALQIGESFSAYGKYSRLRHTVIFGGVGQAPQVEALKKGVDILIACPGRLNDLVGQGFIDLSHIEIFVLDEADRMLDMGFVHDVRRVIAKLPAKRQNLMFSATMPPEIEQLAAGILHDPAFVKVDPVSSTVERIDQKLYFVEKSNKRCLLPWLIQTLDPPVQNALVFSRTKHGADKIARDLNREGISAAAIHGNKSQSARVAALEGFKAGKTKVLVATDIAARGIDINELSHVFNYDLPEVPETYVHRIGRTARAGADGTAISFCAPEEREYLVGIEALNRRKIPVVSGHPWESAAVQASPKATAPVQPSINENEESIMQEHQKRTSGGRNNRRNNNTNSSNSKNNRRTRPEPTNVGTSTENAAPRFDPHFVNAPETTPLRSAKKTPLAAAPVTPVVPTVSRAPERPASKGTGRNSRAVPPTFTEPTNTRTARTARSEPRPRRNSTVSRDEDPGLVLISRRPPQQKFSNFEEYMAAHGGATAPIVDHSTEVHQTAGQAGNGQNFPLQCGNSKVQGGI